MRRLYKKILYELDLNARETLSNIARSCRTSQQMVSYVMHQLLEKNIIQGFSTIFDYSRFDLNSYIVLFRLFYTKKTDLDNFLDNLKKVPELSRFELLEGKWDVYAVFLAPNPSYFNKLLRKVKMDNKNVIRNDMIITTVVTYSFTRSHLLGSKSSEKQYVIVGGDRGRIDLTENQMKICRLLLENPLIKIKEISKKTGLSFLTITKAINYMKDEELIRGFKPVIDFEKAGLTCNKLFIKYQHALLIEDQIVSFCREHPSVVGIVKCFGEWDLIITTECAGSKDFNKFLTEIREKYENMISDFEIMKVLKIEELRFVPKNHFEEIEKHR
ncbi:hypothetical protein AYK26_05650 [Euryarchaeota archaeon SM23-78]|nr:MAG: hypothetical protein AYK26_05650 [Euryarchaeota archaeon SM23-78]MBW3001370.1 Lrp/AsnC family transcriptional regulator [Candidatus Woesearchaeota archaeon]